MSFLLAVQDNIDNLSPKERKFGCFLLENPHMAVRLTITELAKASGSSTSTISRFCRTFQAESFAEFKMKLAVELTEEVKENVYQDIVAGQPLEHIVSAVTTNNIRSISDTSKVVDFNKLKLAIDALHHASRIDLYGTATSGVVAQDFHQKLIRIGKFASVFSDPHMQQTSAASLKGGDVAIGFSYSGETKETIDALYCASEQGATTISITQFGVNRLASHADISLFISSFEAGMRRGDMASRMAQLHLVDMLFLGLVSEYFDAYVPYLEHSYQNVKRYMKQ